MRCYARGVTTPLEEMVTPGLPQDETRQECGCKN